MIMYLLIEIKHNILIQCHGNYIEVEDLKCMLEIDILRKYLLENLGVLRGDFLELGCPNNAQTPFYLTNSCL